MFLFDESLDTLLARSTSLGLSVKEHVDAGRIVRAVNPAELTAGEFSHAVREAVVLRSPSRRDRQPEWLPGLGAGRAVLTMHLRELLTYLNQHGVATLSVLAQHGLVGDGSHPSLDVATWPTT